MPQRLTDMDIDTVSLVDKGANQRRIALLKSANRTSLDAGGPSLTTETTETDHERGSGLSGAWATITKALGIDKADTFDEITADNDMFTAVDEGFGTLRSAVGAASFAKDDDGNDLSRDAKANLVGESIDQFKAFMLDAMTVEKAGRKISGARMGQIKGAFKVLGELINGVENGYWTPPDATGITKGTDEMNEQELRDLVAKMTGEGIAAAFAEDGVAMTAIAKAMADGVTKTETTETVVEKATETVVEPVAPAQPDIAASLAEIATTNGQIIEAVAKLADRTEALEAGRRQSSAAPAAEAAADAKPVAKRSALSGILG